MARTKQSDKVPSWSEARYFQFIRSALRMAWNKYPAKYAALQKARKAVDKPLARHKYELQCACCEQWFPQKDVQVDHKVGAGSLKTYNDLPQFVERLFCGVDNLQILCRSCHMAKTLEERKKEKDDE